MGHTAYQSILCWLCLHLHSDPQVPPRKKKSVPHRSIKLGAYPDIEDRKISYTFHRHKTEKESRAVLESGD